MKTQNSFKLSGADAFLLALESHEDHFSFHDQFCHYILDIEGEISKQSLSDAFEKQGIENMNSLEIKGRHNFTVPFWRMMEEKIPVKIEEISALTASDFEETYTILNESVKNHDNISIQYNYHRDTDTTTLIFRWNHLLLDAFGAYTILNYAGGNMERENIKFYPDSIPVFFNLFGFYKIIRFISNSSHPPIYFPAVKKHPSDQPYLRLLSFDVDESKSIKQHAANMKSGIFLSNYLLACVSKTVHEMTSDGSSDFWVPIPINSRKKGIKGPLFTNPLSFYFFRIKRSLCMNITANVADLHLQMTSQLKKRQPFFYRKLTEFMRFLPLRIYYFFVVGWKRKNHASFMFTMAQTHDETFATFLNKKIKGALNIPPNTYPPGLTFAFMEFNKSLRVMILSRKNIFDELAMDQIHNILKQNLLNP